MGVGKVLPTTQPFCSWVYGECVKRLPAFQTMSKDGQFLDGTPIDICCVTVVSYLILVNMTFKSEM